MPSDQFPRLAEISRPLTVHQTAVSAQEAAASTPMDEDGGDAASTVSIIKEHEDHLYCFPTVQKQGMLMFE